MAVHFEAQKASKVAKADQLPHGGNLPSTPCTERGKRRVANGIKKKKKHLTKATARLNSRIADYEKSKDASYNKPGSMKRSG